MAGIIAVLQLSEPWKGRNGEWKMEASSWKGLKYESVLDIAYQGNLV